MSSNPPKVNQYFFDCQFQAFKSFAKEKSGMEFISFASNPYVENQENYKYRIYEDARKNLGFQFWASSDIGSGKIVNSAIHAIELETNNLVPWQKRYGPKSRPHQLLFEAKEQPTLLREIEKALFSLYRENEDEKLFGWLVSLLGKKYPLIAYLFFLKDRSKYLPIAPDNFDRAFEHLGIDFTTSHKCSWENYSAYLDIIDEIKCLLSESLVIEVTLLDAHSFTWMLACQMQAENKLADVSAYFDLTTTEREILAKGRIGQDRFRADLISYWLTCAVTGFANPSLLRASHIKPWKRGDASERLNTFNGLLLSPTLDACFDAGYISFDDDGNILISRSLSNEDCKILGISADMSLRRIEPAHREFLKYHRENIFKSNA